MSEKLTPEKLVRFSEKSNVRGLRRGSEPSLLLGRNLRHLGF